MVPLGMNTAAGFPSKAAIVFDVMFFAPMGHLPEQLGRRGFDKSGNLGCAATA
jgi:hypothetical protein